MQLDTKVATVSGNIGTFKQGQTLDEPEQIVSYYRTIANEGADSPIKLTDQQIAACIDKFQGDDEDVEVLRVEEIEKLNSQNA